MFEKPINFVFSGTSGYTVNYILESIFEVSTKTIKIYESDKMDMKCAN